MLSKIVGIIILVLAFILRSYQIGTNPPSLSWDEVSIGYNAYSILTTGRDEHGRLFPLDTFVAYGDYKPPLAIYLTVPFVALFGLNEVAVRLPSAVFGTLTVFLTYVLARELFRKREDLALLSALVLAISPWHINLSRAGFEANIALFFAVLGVWLILLARTRPRMWTVALLPFVAAVYTFNSSRIYVMLLLPALLVFTRVRRLTKEMIIGIVIASVIMLPILPHLVSKEARLRFQEVNIFTDSSIVKQANERIERGNIVSKIVNNRRVGFARSFLIHFFDNLEPRFLFIIGDGNPKFSIQDVGQLYLIEAPFLVIGIFAMLKSYPTVAVFLLWWIVAAIIPAATARETPHALRILNSLPTWQIFIAFGIIEVAKKWRYAFMGIIALYLVNGAYYIHNYWRHYPKEYSAEWQYGYREAIQKAGTLADQFDRVRITDSIGRPYMYTLFYTQTDPREFWRTKKDFFDAAGFYHVTGFGKYEFGGFLPDTPEPNTLYIWNAGAIPEGANVIDTVRLLNGNPVLTLFE